MSLQAATGPYTLQHESYPHPNTVIKISILFSRIGGGERCAQGFGGEAWGKEAIGETQT
jgi:hypothetical protein